MRRPLRIVARGTGDYLAWSRSDLRRAYRRLRRTKGMTPFEARSLITDIVLSAEYRKPIR